MPQPVTQSDSCLGVTASLSGSASDAQLAMWSISGHPLPPSLIDDFIERYRPIVVRRCMRYLKDYHDAEDAAQEVFVRAVKAFPTYRAQGPVQAWLRVISDNHCHTILARRALSHHTHMTEADWETIADPATDIAVGLAREHHVAEAMERVPRASRHALRLRYFHNLPLQEVASAMRVSLSAAKMRLYRGQADFRRHYLNLDLVDARSRA